MTLNREQVEKIAGHLDYSIACELEDAKRDLLAHDAALRQDYEQAIYALQQSESIVEKLRTELAAVRADRDLLESRFISAANQLADLQGKLCEDPQIDAGGTRYCGSIYRLEERLAEAQGKLKELEDTTKQLELTFIRVMELDDALKDTLHALEWVTGSPSFGADGEARQGFTTIIKPAIERASAILQKSKS